MRGITATCKSTADQNVACAAKPIWATLKPRPPKQVESLARTPSQLRDPATEQCGNSICEATLQSPLQRSRNLRRDQPEVVVQGVCNPPTHEHPRHGKTDVIVLVTREPLDFLEGGKGLDHPVACFAMVLRPPSPSRPALECSEFTADLNSSISRHCLGTLPHKCLMASGSSWSSYCSEPGAHALHLLLRSRWRAPASVASSSFQAPLSFLADPTKSLGIFQTIDFSSLKSESKM